MPTLPGLPRLSRPVTRPGCSEPRGETPPPDCLTGPECSPPRLGVDIPGWATQRSWGARGGPGQGRTRGFRTEQAWAGLSYSWGRVTLASGSTLSLSFPLYKMGTVRELAPMVRGGQCGVRHAEPWPARLAASAVVTASVMVTVTLPPSFPKQTLTPQTGGFPSPAPRGA